MLRIMPYLMPSADAFVSPTYASTRTYKSILRKRIVRRWKDSLSSWRESVISKRRCFGGANDRIEFETAQLKTTQERVATLRSTVDKEVINVQKLHDTMNAVQIDLEKLQKELERQRVRLTEANEAYQKTNEQSDTLRNTTRDSQRTLDKAMKEISAWNDDIEKSASGRHAIYRRCRLEDIDLPLKSGRLDKVPIEEVSK